MTPVKPITQDLRGFIELLKERYPDEVVQGWKPEIRKGEKLVSPGGFEPPSPP